MKKLAPLVFFFFICCLSSSFAEEKAGYRLDILESNDNYIICEIVFDSVQILQTRHEGAWFTEIKIGGCAYTDKNGLPRLPVTSAVFGIPPASEPRLSVIEEKIVTRSLGDILPVSLPFLDTEESNVTGWFPRNIAQIGVGGFMREQRVVQVEISPVRYHKQSKLTQIVKSLTLRIDFIENIESSVQAKTLASGTVDDPFEGLYERALANYDGSRKWRFTPVARTPLFKTNAILSAPNRYKLEVESDGIYSVTGRELRSAGANLNSIDLKSLALFNRGKPVPILVEGKADGAFDEGDRIVFIGEHNRGDDTYYSFYTETNVYWLTWGQGVGSRFVDMIGSPDLPAVDALTTAKAAIHLENDLIYSRLTYFAMGEKDHWFWQTLNAGAQEYEYPLRGMKAVQNGAIRVRIGMHGQTHPPGSPDHHVLVKLNDELIGEAIWDEQTPYIFDSGSITSANLGNDNRIALILPGDLPDTNVDQVLLNWIDITYERELVATGDSLTIAYESDGTDILKVSGFSTDRIYILTKNGYRLTDVQPSMIKGKYEYLIQNRSKVPTTIHMISDEGLKKVESIVEDRFSDLQNSVNGADYIIITHSDFKNQAQKLADYRSSMGFRTSIVDIEDIYDEFSDGIYDPRAIKSFLKYAYLHWSKPAPSYILLLGDTTHKMEKRVAKENNLHSFVPTMMEYTQSWGMTSSDNFFVAVLGDDELPDMHVGRIPVNTPEEADIVIQKSIDYETRSAVGDWRRHLCLLTGTGIFFEESAQYLYDNYVPKSMLTDWVATLPESPNFGSTEDVAKYINSGQSIINFIGHGGGGIFSDADLFDLEDIDRLYNNNRYPIAFSLTCFIGHFDNDEKSSLAEELLLAPQKGIVANFGSSGRAYLMGNYYLNNALFDAVFCQHKRRVGEIATQGKYEMVQKTRGYWDHVKNYNLLGDPALSFYLPDDIIDMKISNSVLVDGEDLIVEGEIRGFNDGTVIVSVFTTDDSLVVSKESPVANGQFTLNLLTLNSTFRKAWGTEGGEGIIRAYFTDGKADGASAIVFNINRPMISRLSTEPEQPAHLDPVYFSVQLDSHSVEAVGGINSLRLEWTANYRDWQHLNMKKIAANTWRNESPLQQVEGTTIYYKVFINAANNSDIETEEYKYIVRYRPDLYVDLNSIRVSGSSQPILSALIRNDGDMACGPFTCGVFKGFDIENAQPVTPAVRLPGLAAKSDTVFSVLWDGGITGCHDLSFRVDIANDVSESNEKNNSTNRMLRLLNIGQDGSGPLYADDRSFFIRIKPGGLSEHTLVSFLEKQDKTLIERALFSSLYPIRLKDKPSWKAFEICFGDSSVIPIKPIEVTLFYNGRDSVTSSFVAQDALKVYTWNAQSNTWLGLKSQIDEAESSVTADLGPGQSIFALMATYDVAPPVIAIGIESQHLADGDIVSPNPTFTIALEDSSGFDFSGTPVRIFLDDEQIPDDQFTLTHEPHSIRQAIVTFHTETVTGQHHLLVEATDLNGNTGTEELSFAVEGDFKLVAIANHPNPFTDKTIIAFTLQDLAEEVTLDIFTVSGRLIRSFTDLNDVSGYIERDWDGMDDFGNEVANGVYYLRFTARKGEKKIERIEKMAKLK